MTRSWSYNEIPGNDAMFLLHHGDSDSTVSSTYRRQGILHLGTQDGQMEQSELGGRETNERTIACM